VLKRWARGWIIRGSSPGRDWEFFSSPPRPDRLWGSPQPPIQWVPGALSLSGREADHSSPFSAEFKNAWSYTSTPQYAFMAWCSIKAQGQLLPYLKCSRIMKCVLSIVDTLRRAESVGQLFAAGVDMS
jgi:hypothetical protein